MPDMTVSRKQRLRTLENQIRQNYEAFVATGFALKEIRDDVLYEADGFDTWDRYLKERVGAEFGIEQSQARKLITCAQVRIKLPDLSSTTEAVEDNRGGKSEWGQKAVYEFARLAPKNESAHGQPFDLDRLDKRDAARVAKKVIEHCEHEGTKPTATIVRKFVDEDLGVDRAAKAKDTKRQRQEEEKEAERQREEETHPVLDSYFNDMIWRINQDAKHLREIEEEAWKQWKKGNPGLIKRLITACALFTDLLKRE